MNIRQVNSSDVGDERSLPVRAVALDVSGRYGSQEAQVEQEYCMGIRCASTLCKHEEILDTSPFQPIVAFSLSTVSASTHFKSCGLASTFGISYIDLEDVRTSTIWIGDRLLIVQLNGGSVGSASSCI